MLIPVGENILGRRVDPDKISDGGIVLPDQAQEEKGLVEVLAAPEKRGWLLTPGTVVLLDRLAGQPLRYRGEDLLAFRFEDIVAFEAPDGIPPKFEVRRSTAQEGILTTP